MTVKKSDAPKAVLQKPKTSGKSLDEFRSIHDKSYIVPRKIKAAIEALGHDGWEHELGFLRLAGLSTQDLSVYREEFADYFVLIGGRNPKRAWCGSKQLASKLREMV